MNCMSQNATGGNPPMSFSQNNKASKEEHWLVTGPQMVFNGCLSAFYEVQLEFSLHSTAKNFLITIIKFNNVYFV